MPMHESEFNKLVASDYEARRKTIENELCKAGITSYRQIFKTALAQGINIIVPPKQSSLQSVTLIVAHYDGDTKHDNAGGVWLTLRLLRSIWEARSNGRVAALFTDKEEVFQQGALCFLSEGKADRIHNVLCIDGFGSGNEVTVREHAEPFSYKGNIFRMDADVFREKGYKVFTLFSGLDQLETSLMKSDHKFNDDIFEFRFGNLITLAEKAIVSVRELIGSADE